MPTPEPKPQSQVLREHCASMEKNFNDAVSRGVSHADGHIALLRMIGAGVWEIAIRLAELNEFNKAHALRSSFKAGGGPL